MLVGVRKPDLSAPRVEIIGDDDKTIVITCHDLETARLLGSFIVRLGEDAYVQSEEA